MQDWLISVHELFTWVNKNGLNCLLCQPQEPTSPDYLLGQQRQDIEASLQAKMWEVCLKENFPIELSPDENDELCNQDM